MEKFFEMKGKLCFFSRGKWGKLHVRYRGNSNSSVAALMQGDAVGEASK